MRMITSDDLSTLKQRVKKIVIKAEILNEDKQVIQNIDGAVMSGSYSVNADSDVRRTCNLEVSLDKCDVEFTELIYFCCYIRIQIGYYSFVARDTLYYNIGTYCFDSNSVNIDASTNTLSLSLSDKMILLDSDHRGTIYGALEPTIYRLDPDTGQEWTKRDADGNELKDSDGNPIIDRDRLNLKNIVEGLIVDFGITEYMVEEIGNYTHENSDEGEWNELPYDLEFSKGVGLNEILDGIKDLYDFYEMFFDVDGVFHFQKMPTLENDICVLNEEIVNPLIINENMDRNIYDVKNVIEIWGADLEADRYARNNDGSNGKPVDDTIVTYSTFKDTDGVYADLYNIKLDGFTEEDYVNGLQVGIKIPANCDNKNQKTYIKINDLPNAGVYKTVVSLDTGENRMIDAETLDGDTTYIFRYKKGITTKMEDGKVKESVNGFYFLGVYQVHSLAVLTDGSFNSNYQTDDERLEYFKKKYNVNEVSFNIDINSPFTIEKIGEVHCIPDDSTYETIFSDQAALSTAEYELWKRAKRTDTISLEMILVPWLDVNQKIKYVPQGETKAYQFIVKSINADFSNGTMTVEIMKFYNYNYYQ